MSFPGQPGYVITSESSGSALGFPPSWSCPKHIHVEVCRRYFNQVPETTSQASFQNEELVL